MVTGIWIAKVDICVERNKVSDLFFSIRFILCFFPLDNWKDIGFNIYLCASFLSYNVIHI